jgi:hypothetical protein
MREALNFQNHLYFSVHSLYLSVLISLSHQYSAPVISFDLLINHIYFLQIISNFVYLQKLSILLLNIILLFFSYYIHLHLSIFLRHKIIRHFKLEYQIYICICIQFIFQNYIHDWCHLPLKIISSLNITIFIIQWMKY